MTSIERDMRQLIASLPVQLLEFTYHKGHFKFTLKYGERTRKFTASGSPASPKANIHETRRYIKRFIEGRD